MGGGGRSRRRYDYQHSDDDSDESDSEATEVDMEDEAQAEVENALVQSALARIRKAKSKGKQDVRLNKEELAALERRRKRLQAEAEANARKASGERRQRKEKEERYAVPLSQFDGPPAPNNYSNDALPRHPLPSSLTRSQERLGPPAGLFPPPTTSQTRPRSSTSSSHRPPPDREGSASPFDYQYVSNPSRPVSSVSSRRALPHEEGRRSRNSPPSQQQGFDPFQFQTEGPRVPYMTRSQAAMRTSRGYNEDDLAYGGEETAPEDDSGSDGRGNGAQIRNASQEDVIVIEGSPASSSGRSRAKKSSSRAASPGKRKTGGRRRKGK
ncbi:hypothetical protein GGR57DRAFT_249928 [Xylariaceae sp. FL1272]|nr:hypothetical protein GGR57DRAFT_249928 [Xylariaceae sp. FL1272]